MATRDVSIEVLTMPRHKELSAAMKRAKQHYKQKMWKFVSRGVVAEKNEYTISFTATSEIETVRPGHVFQQIRTVMFPDGLPPDMKYSFDDDLPFFGWYRVAQIRWFDNTFTIYQDSKR